MKTTWYSKSVIWLLLGWLSVFSYSCEMQVEDFKPEQAEFMAIDKVDQFIEGQYIVVLHEKDLSFRKTDNYEDVQAAMRVISNNLVSRYGVAPEKVKHVFGNLLSGFSVELTENQLGSMRTDPAVDYIEQDGWAYLSEVVQTNATWGIDRIDQRDRPLSNTYSYNSTGKDVVAYIVDSGIRSTHSEFDGRVILGYDAVNDGNEDCNGHGTHVAGTVGGKLYGVSKEVLLVSARVFPCSGGAAYSTIISAMDWIITDYRVRKKPAVTNMSLGGGASSTMDNAVTKMFNEGIAVIVAAGNSNADACNYSPARAANAFAVGSTTSTDTRSSFSNFGTCVNIFAPGSSITAAYYRSDTDYGVLSGTSMASPHTAGVAALYLQRYPNATPKQVYDFLRTNATPNKVTDAGTGSPNLLLFSIFDLPGGNDPDEPILSDPKIVSFSTVESSNRNFTRSIATWKVADPGAKLQSVRLELLNNGSTVASQTISISGSSAEGSNELSVRGSATHVRITLTADGKTFTRTNALTEGDNGGDQPEDPGDGPVDDPNPPVGSIPVIDSFTVSRASSGPWNNGTANWTVSDVASALQSVKIELLGSTGSVLETSIVNISGGSASGSTQLKSRTSIGGMRLTVTAGGITSLPETRSFQ